MAENKGLEQEDIMVRDTTHREDNRLHSQQFAFNNLRHRISNLLQDTLKAYHTLIDDTDLFHEEEIRMRETCVERFESVPEFRASWVVEFQSESELSERWELDGEDVQDSWVKGRSQVK